MNEILKKLAEPFHPAHVTWKPGATNRDKTKALGMAYADIRAYMNRLDEVCGLDWAVTYKPWGERIICELTIAGVTRSSTGEADSQSEKSEIAGTAAEAQAFKRACAMFGLGRYLYQLPTIWAEYDADRRQFTEAGQARLQGVITSHYQRNVSEEARPQRTSTAALVGEFNALGESLYGEQWPQVRRRNCERISQAAGVGPDDLSAEQLSKLISGLKQLQRQRTAA